MQRSITIESPSICPNSVAWRMEFSEDEEDGEDISVYQWYFPNVLRGLKVVVGSEKLSFSSWVFKRVKSL